MIFFVAVLVGGVLLFPQGGATHTSATEEIRTPQGHHHRTIYSWTTDADDDGVDDDADDIAVSPAVYHLASIDEPTPLPTEATFVPLPDLGPSTGHAQSVERPPRA